MNKKKIFNSNSCKNRRFFLRGLSLIILILFILIGCKADKGKEIIDRSGRTVTINNEIKRIISTAPSNTEIIADIGQAHKLIAVDVHSSDIKGLPANLPLLDFFFPDAEAIIKLEPDLIIASGHNATGTGEDPLRMLREMGVPVVYISMSKSITDIFIDIMFIAELLQAEEEGNKLVNSMVAHISEVAQISSNIETRKSVYFEISAAPYMMTFGKDSFINDMISTIGARNIFENENWLVSPGAESIIELNPDVILTSVNYIDDPIGEIKNRPGFNYITAVKNNDIYQIDNNSSSRSSARITLALKQMSQAVYPELYE